MYKSLCATSIMLTTTLTAYAVKTTQEFAQIPAVAMNTWEYLTNTPLESDTTRIILIRHGESESNKLHGVAGRTEDSPLSSTGVEQAIAAAAYLSKTNICIGALYASPMQRAIETGRLILPKTPVNIDARLHEKFYGPLEGKSHADYLPYIEKEKQEFPLLTFGERFNYKVHPDVESMQEIYNRLLPLLLEIHHQHKGQYVLATTHGALMKSPFLWLSSQLGYESDYRSINILNTGTLVIDIKNDIPSLAASSRINFSGYTAHPTAGGEPRPPAPPTKGAFPF